MVTTLDQCVSNFLSWKLPFEVNYLTLLRNMSLDCSIKTGNSLFTADQARAMLQEVCAPMIAENERLKEDESDMHKAYKHVKAENERLKADIAWFTQNNAQKLCKLYGVSTCADLVSAQETHILRLQAELSALEKQEPFGTVVEHRHNFAFYEWGDSPYLDNAKSHRIVYAEPKAPSHQEPVNTVLLEALKHLRTAVCFAHTKDFGDGEEINMCWEARVPVAFIEKASAAIAAAEGVKK